MTSSSPARSRSKLAGVAVLASAVVASGLTPLLTGAATAATLLPAPPLVSPSDATSKLKEVVLDWAPVTGATSYLVQVGTDHEWSDTPTLELTSVATRITLPTSLPHASYVWRVAAMGADGQGRWSTAGTFTRGWTSKATPLTPAAGTVVGPAVGRPTFSWTPVASASEYQLQVSTSPYFDAPFRTSAGDKTEACFTTRTSVTPFTGQANAKNDGAGDCVFTLLGTGETRYWRVRPLDHVVDGAAEVDTTPIVDEGISSRPPSAEPDSLDTSACGTGSVATPAPTASASPSASPSATASPAPASGGSCEPAHKVEKGPWSASTAFSSVYPASAPDEDSRYQRLAPIDAPALSADVCTADLCRDFPTVSWPAVEGATRYRLYVALDADYDNIQAIVETSALRWTPTDQWRESTAGGSYYVVVQPCTTQGATAGCGAVGAPSVFRKSSPKLAATAPASAARLAGREVELKWQSAADALSAATGSPATSEAYAYRVQVTTAANPDFVGTGLVDDVTVDTTHHVSSTKTYADGSYLWRVQAVDASGHKQPWSVVRGFTLDGTAPSFTATPATGLAVTGAVKVVFSEPVRGITATSIGLRSTPVTVQPSTDGRTVTLVPQARLLAGATYTVQVAPTVTDLAGNPVAAATKTVAVNPLLDDRSPAVALSGYWQRLVASNAVARTYSRSVPTTARPTSASVAIFGSGVEVKGCVGPANGVLELWADGVRVARMDTYRTYSGCGVVLARTALKGGATIHRLQLRGVGVKNARSTGTAVALDAVTAIR